MFGIDIGLNIASVVLIGTNRVAYFKVHNFKDLKGMEDFSRIELVARALMKSVVSSGLSAPVTIEEPIYSWGRRNPKGFAKSVMLFTMLKFLLQMNGYKVYSVNNKSAKKMAGSGTLDKEGMIKAFQRQTKQKMTKFPLYAQETIADSYFIAKMGKQLYGTGRET